MNKYGSIWFHGLTDITRTDLARTVTITQKYVEVYPDDQNEVKPTIG